jgi:hypothetical protein
MDMARAHSDNTQPLRPGASPTPRTHTDPAKGQGGRHARLKRQLGGDDLLGLCIALVMFAAIASALHTRELDIAVYRQAAERVFAAGVDPYQRRDGDVLPFTYPPTALFLIYPFSRLDLADAERLVWHLNLALVPILMLPMVRDLAEDDPGRRLVLWGPIYIAAFGGVYLTLAFHQINLLILLFLWVYWRSVRRGRYGYGAGAALALGSVAKPHYALLLLGCAGPPAAKAAARRGHRGPGAADPESGAGPGRQLGILAHGDRRHNQLHHAAARSQLHRRTLEPQHPGAGRAPPGAEQVHRTPGDRVRGGRSPRLPTEPCVRVRTRLLTQGVSTDAHQTSAVTACPSEWLVPAPQ